MIEQRNCIRLYGKNGVRKLEAPGMKVADWEPFEHEGGGEITQAMVSGWSVYSRTSRSLWRTHPPTERVCVTLCEIYGREGKLGTECRA
jgi:hypothetical protein